MFRSLRNNWALGGTLAATLGLLAFIFLAAPRSEITVKPGFVPLAEAGENTYGLLDIENSGDASDRLTGASSDVARVELHDGNMKVLDSIEIPANGEVLMTGDPHIMFMDLRKDLKLGDKVKVKLTFANHETVTVVLPVTQEDGHNHEHGDEK